MSINDILYIRYYGLPYVQLVGAGLCRTMFDTKISTEAAKLSFIANLSNPELFYSGARNGCAPLTPNLYVQIK